LKNVKTVHVIPIIYRIRLTDVFGAPISGAYPLCLLSQITTSSSRFSRSWGPILPADVDVFELSETSTLFIEVISSRIKKAKGFFQVMATPSVLKTAASAISLRIAAFLVRSAAA